jgi:hypothetical protein
LYLGRKRRALAKESIQATIVLDMDGSETVLGWYWCFKIDCWPTTNNQQPTTNNQQPTTNNQQPTTNNMYNNAYSQNRNASILPCPLRPLMFTTNINCLQPTFGFGLPDDNWQL